jgi:fluoride exporter
MADSLWVFLGGGLGAVARYALGAWIVARAGAAFPLHTLAINVSGSFAIGLLLAVLAARFHVGPAARLFLVVGFLGGYTTFSSYSYEALALIESGALRQAALYVLGSNALSLLACLGGVAAGRTFVLH